MATADALNTCAMCGGRFPGPGIEAGGEIYCCDKCADRHQHKMRLVTAMAPKVIGILGIGAVLGYLVGRKRSRRI